MMMWQICLSFNKERFRHLHFAFVQIFICILFPIKGRSSKLTEIRVNARERVRFNCSVDSGTSVDWQFQKISDGKTVNIFTGNARGGGGHKSNAYRSQARYRIEIDIQSGRYDLILDNVTKADEGFYSCCDVSNPDSFADWRLNVLVKFLEEDENEVCSNDVIASVGDDVIMTFMTKKKDSIQLKHHSAGRNYPLHVYLNGRLVNDYIVPYGRFSFSASDDSWILKIKNVQTSDAGSFVCSEDNGLGKHYAKELVVITERGVVCSADSEPCNREINLTCAAKYFGNCPPRIQISTDESIQIHNGKPELAENIVYLTGLMDKTDLAVCRVETQSSTIKSTCMKPMCNGIKTRSSSRPSAMVITTSLVVISARVVHGSRF